MNTDTPLPHQIPTEEQQIHDSSENLSGVQKAAIFLVSIGTEQAAEVFQHMPDEEVEAVSIAIANLEDVSPDVIEEVMTEFHDMAKAQDYMTQGGTSFARKALTEALGEDRAEKLMMKIEAATEVSGFRQLQTVDTDQLTRFIEGEHPQTAALIFSHLNPIKSAEVLQGLTEEVQAEILFRLATMGKTSPAFIDDVEEVLRERMDAVLGSELSDAGGVEVAADILNAVPRSSMRYVINEIRDRDQQLANEIKNTMFVFDDLVQLNAQDLQKLLMEIDQPQLALALKAAPESLKGKVFDNLSSRVAEMVREEIDLLGQVRVSDVEEAQKEIMAIARELEEKEEIVLARAAEGDFIE